MRAVFGLFHHGYGAADYRRLLRMHGWARFGAQYTLKRVAGWVLLTALTVLAFQVGDSGAAALLILAFVLPRALLLWLDVRALSSRLGWWVHALAVPLALALLLVSPDAPLTLLALLALPLGLVMALAEQASQARVGRSELAVAGALFGRIEQLSLVAGTLLAALTLVLWDATAALGLAAALFTLSALLATPLLGGRLAPGAPGDSAVAEQGRATVGARALGLLTLGLFAGALAAMTARAALVAHVVDGLGQAEAVYAVLLAAIGLGALVGPLSMPKLLGHLPADLSVALLAGALGVGLIALSRETPVLVLALVLFVVGLVSVTLDLVAGTLSRRLIPAPELNGALSLLGRAVLAGQLVGLLGTLALSSFMSAGDILLVSGVVCALGPGIAFLLAGRLGWGQLAVRR